MLGTGAVDSSEQNAQNACINGVYSCEYNESTAQVCCIVCSEVAHFINIKQSGEIGSVGMLESEVAVLNWLVRNDV